MNIAHKHTQKISNMGSMRNFWQLSCWLCEKSKTYS